ncbi:MAG: hypothetical protein LC130_13405 [Bryobacterales bacterium]|nr:hypothetical protein [Bryobacterales bacterium]MEB2362829.1 hypothetical protein [Bryobacterales bacterium]
MMLRLVFAGACAFASLCFGQAAGDLFSKATPDVDAALRGRVTKFYQAHVDGKFRVADEVVAEDSKEIFFAAQKTRYKGFEIVKIAYSDQFTKAQVVVAVDTDMAFPGMGKVAVKAPLTTLWKLENGEWFWYVNPSLGKETPFGLMKPGEGESAGGLFVSKGPDPQALIKMVTVDKTKVQLGGESPIAEVHVSNGMSGAISLSLEYSPAAGFEASLDTKEVVRSGSAKILIRSVQGEKAPGSTATLRLHIQPLGHTIPIEVQFADAAKK